MEPHVDDVEYTPIPTLHDFYYEMRDGIPVLITEQPHDHA